MKHDSLNFSYRLKSIRNIERVKCKRTLGFIIIFRLKFIYEMAFSFNSTTVLLVNFYDLVLNSLKYGDLFNFSYRLLLLFDISNESMA